MAREKIAEALKLSRKNAGLTCEQVGNLVGKSAKTINAWEHNKGQPDADTFTLLCKIYDVKNIMVLFGESDGANEEKLLSTPGVSKETGRLVGHTTPEQLLALGEFLQTNEPTVDSMTEILKTLPVEAYEEVEQFLLFVRIKHKLKEGHGAK